MYTEIISFEAACAALGLDPLKILPDVTMYPEKHQKAITANHKLIIIAEAIQEGWTPNWNDDDQYKWFPYFDMENGFGFRDTCCWTYSYGSVGSRLCFESSEKARWFGEQFLDLHKDFLTL